MARANRHHIPGQVWHITHRCHKKEFLLKFAKDRQRWRYWLFEAKKRFGLQVLNYMATSNHVHLLVLDNHRDPIPKSLQLIAGRTAQEYNHRKARNGAFWEDRYHATAIDHDEHLLRCLVYIDLNMVRAGVVRHPSEWDMCGYNEIQNPSTRYGVIDHQELPHLCGVSDPQGFKEQYRQWVEVALAGGCVERDGSWTESVAVGNREFVEDIKTRLGIKAIGKKIRGQEGSLLTLREHSAAYNALLGPEKGCLSLQNTYFWDFS